MIRFFLLIALTTLVSTGSAQTRFRVMEYNVENLFDTVHDSLKADQEYLPEGSRKWTRRKYWTKLQHISQVIASASDPHLPDVVMLCEVENDSTMHYLTRRSPLRLAGYEYFLTDSRDQRGIDVAFLYQKATFKPLSHRSVRIPSERIGASPTRDILHVCGLTQTADTLDFFLCHFPSKSRGAKVTEPHRRLAVETLLQELDSVVHIRRVPRIIISGDFNDGMRSASLSSILSVGYLTDLMANKKPGTYKYQGKWENIDHMIVSHSLLEQTDGHLYTIPEWTVIHQPPFLLEEDKKFGGVRPLRTYLGLRYQAGYSDHLPILTDFFW